MGGGGGWGPVCSGPALGASVDALQVIGSTLYVGGTFQNGAGIASADYLLACDLNTGAASSTVVNDGDISGAVYALTADSNGTLYAGGTFVNMAGNLAADYVASMDATGWHNMGAGAGPGGGAVTGIVRSLTASGTEPSGSDASDIRRHRAGRPHVAKWSGGAWSAMGSNTSGTDGWFPATAYINAMTTSGARVFATGSFQNANGDPLADEVAYYDGTAWHPLGSNGAGDGPTKRLRSRARSFQGESVGGNFTSAGAIPTPGSPPPGNSRRHRRHRHRRQPSSRAMPPQSPPDGATLSRSINPNGSLPPPFTSSRSTTLWADPSPRRTRGRSAPEPARS